MKKWKIDRIISVATLVSSALAFFLVLKKPQPIGQPQPPAVAAANAQSFQTKVQQFEQPKEPGQPPAEVRLNSDEVGAALMQGASSIPVSSIQAASGGGLPTTVPSSPDAAIASGEPEVKDYQVRFDGDVARGQFVTKIAGKDVYVTLAGHLGAKDGYATFDPTEFKVGDLSVPVSLVNDALQKRLGEQRDRLKLPDDVGDMKVENGQLVMTQK
jgi:type IV secretory pathway VirB9-like protein